MHLARWSNLFKARWTEDIHDEWTRSVARDHPEIEIKKLERTRELMDLAVPDALIERYRYQDLVQSLSLPDAEDRHVLAAAISCGAQLIVTLNVRDFPDEILKPYHMGARHPDDFVTDLIDLDEAVVKRCLLRQQSALKNPPLTLIEVMAFLEKAGLRNAMARLR